ncbi:MAG: helix-turn-helix domain-containing protein [Nanoarchaeota archaeon]|nr:helix-turn-helix domain-containing protein [Nanoarchaeota archaeon]
MLMKTQARIMRLFAGQIIRMFTIREIARELKMHVSLAHRAIVPLIKERLLKRNEQKLISIDYSGNHETLAYIEYLRSRDFLSKPKNRDVGMFAMEVTDKIGEESFVLLLFGSAVISPNPRDIDILLIVDDTEKIEFHERFLENICSGFSLKFEPRVISFESAYEMLGKREEANIMNETLNKHLILYGAGLFYRLVKKGRK